MRTIGEFTHPLPKTHTGLPLVWGYLCDWQGHQWFSAFWPRRPHPCYRLDYSHQEPVTRTSGMQTKLGSWPRVSTWGWSLVWLDLPTCSRVRSWFTSENAAPDVSVYFCSRGGRRLLPCRGRGINTHFRECISRLGCSRPGPQLPACFSWKVLYTEEDERARPGVRQSCVHEKSLSMQNQGQTLALQVFHFPQF